MTTTDTPHQRYSEPTFRRALSVLVNKGPGVFLAESRLRLRMRMAWPYVRCEGCRFDSKLLPANVLKSLLSDAYEVCERRALAALDPALPLVECGGGLGVVACIANRLLHEPAQHVVVEANPALLPILARHAELNGCHFEVVHAAIGYHHSTTQFFLSGNPLASSCERRTKRQIDVNAVSLGSLLERYDRANVMCDIEGTEVELIEQEQDAWSKVETLILEVHEEIVGAERIRAALTTLQKRHGFRLDAIHGDVAVLSAGSRA